MSPYPPVRDRSHDERLWPLTLWAAVLCFVAGVAIASMSGCVTPRSAYVQADRLTYDAVAPEYGAYVEADPGLSDEQKARRRRTLDAWGTRLERAEADSEEPAGE